MNVELSSLEVSILEDYRKHLEKFQGQKFTQRDILTVILGENRDELKIIKRDLESEEANKLKL